jgi:hypothetical protein
MTLLHLVARDEGGSMGWGRVLQRECRERGGGTEFFIFSSFLKNIYI